MRLPDRDRKAVIVLAAWALVALAWETGEVVQRNRGLYFDEWEVSVWRPGAPPQQRLEWFLRETEKRIPPGTRVAFTSVLDDRGDAEALSLYLWATHLLPGHTLRPVSAAGDPAVLDDVAYWATYNTTIEHPRARLLFRHPAGAVYRVVP